jgi:hypothetical protein
MSLSSPVLKRSPTLGEGEAFRSRGSSARNRGPIFCARLICSADMLFLLLRWGAIVR